MDLETRKAEVRERIEEGLEIVHDLEDERGNLNAARAEADEKDRAKYTAAHGEWAQHKAGERPNVVAEKQTAGLGTVGGIENPARKESNEIIRY